MSQISDKILTIINTKNMSYGELAKITKIPKSALQRYATGETEKIPITRLEKIASALGTTAAYLMGWDNISVTNDGIRTKISELPPEAQKDLLDYIELLELKYRKKGR